MRILAAADVRQALPMAAAIVAVETGFAALARGEVDQPLRAAVAGRGGVMLAMPAAVAGVGLGLKLVSVFPGNAAAGLPSVAGAVLLVDPGSGIPLALLEGRTLTAIRTGAASGVATRYLAAPQASTVAIFGAGAQAPWQVAAVCAVRPITRVLVVNRSPARALALAELLRGWGQRVPTRVEVVDAPTALAAADVVCCATAASAPLFADADLRPGTHLNAVGAYTPTMVEVPASTVARARVVVDQAQAAWAEAGDLIQARDAGLLDPASVSELGAIVTGQAPGRNSADQVTLFKSVGLGMQDIVAAQAALANASAAHIGHEVPW